MSVWLALLVDSGAERSLGRDGYLCSSIVTFKVRSNDCRGPPADHIHFSFVGISEARGGERATNTFPELVR